jgi:GAF domain-containing protein
LELLYTFQGDLGANGGGLGRLPQVLQLALEGVGASSGSILVLDERGEVVLGALAYAGKVHQPTSQQLADTVQQGLAGWVIENRQAALVRSTRDDRRWLRRAWDESNGTSRSAISVPLIASDRVAGVLTLVHPRSGQFTEDDLALLTAIAACISFNGANVLKSPQLPAEVPVPLPAG